ncbi:hypothetical protein [Paenibacillus sp. R14(2021)]|uniref:hypothetical protein n=1 Tax=Paenibacillus sp. R14(2021) TaxID=2859228 RepID=UPI001C6167DF|nr:hypothetical protein [Paenibacillus sp. R14(2021)]
MNDKHEHNDPVICPWCHTEIVWDEEIGPERYCPHCENELTGYRTLQLGLDDEEEVDETAVQPVEDEDEDEEEADWEADSPRDLTDLREFGRERLALEETMEGILDEQLEAPECPSCREFMLEAGTQFVTGEQFKPRTPAVLGEPIVETPFALLLYVCPSCFHTESRLSVHDQERLVHLLTKASATDSEEQ